jgi:hypothetical protein
VPASPVLASSGLSSSLPSSPVPATVNARSSQSGRKRGGNSCRGRSSSGRGRSSGGGSSGGESSRGGSSNKGPGRRKRTNWTTQLKEIHLDVLIQCKYDGLQTDGSMKKEAFTRVCAVLITSPGGADIDEDNCRTRYYTVHGIWRCWLDHLNATSGWGRDEQGVPINDEDVMDEYFAKHPDRAQFRGNLPENYNQLQELFGERSATGALALGGDIIAEDGGDWRDPEAPNDDTLLDDELPLTSASPDQGSSPDQSSDQRSASDTNRNPTDVQNLRKRALTNATAAASNQGTSKKLSGNRALAEGFLKGSTMLSESLDTLSSSIVQKSAYEIAISRLEKEFPDMELGYQCKVMDKLGEGRNAEKFNALPAKKRLEFIKILVPRDANEDSD